MNMKYVIVLVIAIATVAEGAVYTVGDDMGWMVPPTPDYYTTWVSKYHFVVNDSLAFKFPQGKHDVALLTKEDFDACNTKNPLDKFQKPLHIRLSSIGTYYFTCSFGGHCASGQKFAITTAASKPLPPSPFRSPTNSAAVDRSTESLPFKFVSEKMRN